MTDQSKDDAKGRGEGMIPHEWSGDNSGYASAICLVCGRHREDEGIRGCNPMTDKDDATIEEAKRDLERMWSHSPLARIFAALIDIATRRGERIKELENERPVILRDLFVKSRERDALAEENKRLMGVLEDVAYGHDGTYCEEKDLCVKCQARAALSGGGE